MKNLDKALPYDDDGRVIYESSIPQNVYSYAAERTSLDAPLHILSNILLHIDSSFSNYFTDVMYITVVFIFYLVCHVYVAQFSLVNRRDLAAIFAGKGFLATGGGKQHNWAHRFESIWSRETLKLATYFEMIWRSEKELAFTAGQHKTMNWKFILDVIILGWRLVEEVELPSAVLSSMRPRPPNLNSRRLEEEVPAGCFLRFFSGLPSGSSDLMRNCLEGAVSCRFGPGPVAGVEDAGEEEEEEAEALPPRACLAALAVDILECMLL
ncbi:hypothetical protein TYRP_022748 [Tyrophagus putrescentiae]|nr:hypothetical protein TYRP_022748 [Tyrophagus putrescentiae]